MADLNLNQEKVDSEVSLLVDVSRSIISSEYDLQVQGYADAFNNPDLYNNLISQGIEGQVAVNVIMWSDSSQQQEVVPWTLIDSVTASQNFAQDILSISRPFFGGTNPGSAIDFAVPLFSSNTFDGRRWTIDVSGDGGGSSSISSTARDNAIAAGVDVINGIVIGGDSSVKDFYDNYIIAGTNANGSPAFTKEASDFTTFKDAIDEKLTIEFTPPPQISISDVSVLEGNSGTTDFIFDVTLSKTNTEVITVDYTTADGTASGGTDYIASNGTLTFNPGETTKIINIPVNGDNIVESDETFFVNLSNATNADILDPQGEGTIINDDKANSSISGTKWNDLDGDGVRDANEPGLENWTIYLDQNQNGQLDNGEISTTTDANGDYTFTDLTPDTYHVAEVLQGGWKQTYPNEEHHVVGYEGVEITDIDFGNRQCVGCDDEPNDTIPQAVTGLNGINGEDSFFDKGFIGDNPNIDPSDDVDLIELQLKAGQRVTIDIDSRDYDSALDSALRLFDSAGNELAFSDDNAAPGESYTRDSFIDFTASATDTYYVGVSSYCDFYYDPFIEGSGKGYTTGEYDISILLENGSISGTKWNDLNGDGARSTIINTIDNPGGLNPDQVDVQLVSGDDLTFDITVTVPESSELPLDFVLLQDLSGSFGNDVSTLRTLVPDLVSSVLLVQPNTTFGVASFVDKPISHFGGLFVSSVLSDTPDTTFGETSFVDQPISPVIPISPTPPVIPISPVTPVTPIPPFGGSSDYVYQTDLALTTDTNLFQTTVNNLVTLSGGDAPESQLEALMQVALRETEVGYRPGSRRVVLLTTDNTYHIAGDGSAAGITTPNNGDNILDGSPAGTGEDYPDINQVRSALISANIVPIFAVTSDQISTYQNLVDQLGFGVVEQLTSNSSNIVNAVTSGLNQAFQDIVMVAQSDDYSYVESITPTSYSNVPGGESRTFTVTLDTDTSPVIPDTITLTALGFGDTEVNVSTAPETGLAGVEIYLDLNNNGVLDPDEPSTFTATDDPNTPEDETGYYEFTGLSAGDYVVREVVPSGYVQTSPIRGFHQISLAQNENVTDIDFENRLDSLTPVISPTIKNPTDGSTIPTLITGATNNSIPENTDELVPVITNGIQSDDSFKITDTEQSETINGEISAIQNDEVALFAPQANQILTNEITNSSTDSLEQQLEQTTSEQVGGGITSIEDVVTENTVSLNEQIVSAATSVEEIPIITADVDGTTIEGIDLTTFATDKVTVDYTISREADFDNQVYFYAVDDITGTVDGVAVGEDNYIETALSNLVSPVFSTSDDNTETGSLEFDAGSIILPVIIADGTLNEALSGDAEVYLPFSGANSDNFDHIKLLDNNIFGFEDLPNGGDRDFNDIQITINSIA